MLVLEDSSPLLAPSILAFRVPLSIPVVYETGGTLWTDLPIFLVSPSIFFLWFINFYCITVHGTLN
jgi:hypothetical protein